MARQRNEPGDPLEGLSGDELRELAARANALIEAEAEADAAGADEDVTPEAERDAEREAEEARAELEATAERVGLSEEQTEALLDAFERRSEAVTERVVRGLLEEYTVEPEPEPAPEPEPEPEPAASLADLQDEPEAEPAPPPEPDKPPETPPERTHWFNRPLIKREDDA